MTNVNIWAIYPNWRKLSFTGRLETAAKRHIMPSTTEWVLENHLFLEKISNLRHEPHKGFQPRPSYYLMERI